MFLIKFFKSDLLKIIKSYHLRKHFYGDLKSSKEKVIFGNFRNCVIVSQSRDIYENLAIEDWIYRYQEFDNNQLLLIWYNYPSIVIGRHQNPWQEVNLDKCLKANISIARRNSGGGTVYHDLNNLNICFFTSKKAYNRKNNLEFIKNVVKKSFDIDLKINSKDDLIFDKTGEKVSGTASKLAFNKGYHHCTLLIDSNLQDLSKYIKKKSDTIVSNATKSIYSPVKNLTTINPQIKIEDVIDALVNSYKKINDTSNVYYANFNENEFQTISDLKNQFKDWNWIYGKTPKFKIIKNEFINNEKYTCELNIVKGLIEKMKFFNGNIQLNDSYIPDLIVGKKLIFEDCELVLNEWLKTSNNFKSIYFSKLVLDTVKSVM